jgi:hypothetical protein
LLPGTRLPLSKLPITASPTLDLTANLTRGHASNARAALTWAPVIVISPTSI